MSNCLNCDKPIKQVEGRRPRKFCDNKGKCKGEYHRKANRSKDVVSKAKYDAVLKELQDLKITSAKVVKENGKSVAKFEGEIPDAKKPDITDEKRLARIKELQNELNHVPANPMIGKKKWIAIREQELNELNNL